MSKQRFPRLTEPKTKKKRNRKIVYVLLLFFITLFVVLFFKSSISKIDKIEVIGNHYTTVEQIGQVLGVKQGDPFFSVSAAKLEKRLSRLPNIEEISVVKRFPGQIRVKISENKEVAYSIGIEGKMKILLSNGNQVSPIQGDRTKMLPVLSGWENQFKNQQKLCKLLAEIPQSLLTDISQINPNPSTSYPDRIHIYTRTYFEVVTTIEYFPDKIKYMRAIIGDKTPGEIILLEANSYRPYNVESAKPMKEKKEEQSNTNTRESVRRAT